MAAIFVNKKISANEYKHIGNYMYELLNMMAKQHYAFSNSEMSVRELIKPLDDKLLYEERFLKGKSETKFSFLELDENTIRIKHDNISICELKLTDRDNKSYQLHFNANVSASRISDSVWFFDNIEVKVSIDACQTVFSGIFKSNKGGGGRSGCRSNIKKCHNYKSQTNNLLYDPSSMTDKDGKPSASTYMEFVLDASKYPHCSTKVVNIPFAAVSKLLKKNNHKTIEIESQPRLIKSARLRT